MADDSPGKVQALRAIFSERNQPVMMGIMPPNGKIAPAKPWRSSSIDCDSRSPAASLKDKMIEQRTSQQLPAKVLPFPFKRTGSAPASRDSDPAALTDRASKPNVGPKPSHLSQQQRSGVTPESSRLSETGGGEGTGSLSRSQAKSRAVAETIATFMFANGVKPGDPQARTARPPDKQPDPLLSAAQKSEQALLSRLVSSDNYICKSKCKLGARRVLPPLDELGPAPPKPLRPPQVVLPEKYRVPKKEGTTIGFQTSSQPPPPHQPPTVPHRPAPQRPSYPCPPRPHTPPPLPPLSAPVIKPPMTLREEIEELYEDTLLGENKRPVSLIPEYTAEEEEAEELYNDADFDESPSLPSTLKKPKDPPPPCPSEYLQPKVQNIIEEELYQDADEVSEEFYEVMPCDAISEEPDSPVYSNNKKEIGRLRREEQKKSRKEQKEREKRGKEMEKLRRKFGLSGDEVPIDDGLVKADSRGGKGDLPVRKGETVLILRMEGNPQGRWLVKNEKGKIGYVELTNIEVDPLSVKSVMSIRRLSVISLNEELYCEARSEEGIYEVTY